MFSAGDCHQVVREGERGEREGGEREREREGGKRRVE